MKDPLSRLIATELGRMPRLHPRTAPRLTGDGAGEASGLVEEHVEREWANGVPTGVVHTRHVDGRTGRAIEARVPQSVQRKARASSSEPLARDVGASLPSGNASAASTTRELSAPLPASPRDPSHDVPATEAGRRTPEPTSAAAQLASDAVAGPPTTERFTTEVSPPVREQLPLPSAPAATGATEPALERSMRPAWASPGVPREPAIAADEDDALREIPASQTPSSWDPANRDPRPADSALRPRSISVGLDLSAAPNEAGSSTPSPVSQVAAPSFPSIAPLAAPRISNLSATGASEVSEEATRARSSLPSRGAVARPDATSAAPPPALGFGLGSGGLAEAIRTFAASAGPSDAPNRNETGGARVSPSSPVVRVRIGRLEVHAPALVAPAASQVERPQPGLSLEALLRLREES